LRSAAPPRRQSRRRDDGNNCLDVAPTLTELGEIREQPSCWSALRVGVPLDDALRAEFETSLGTELDGVRVHTGADATAAARALSANAFAVGNDVVFREGAYVELVFDDGPIAPRHAPPSVAAFDNPTFGQSQEWELFRDRGYLGSYFKEELEAAFRAAVLDGLLPFA
jgi:hypothetical protein